MNEQQLIRQAGTSASGSTLNDTRADHELIYIGSNENPYGPSDAAKEAMMNTLLTTNRYQWDETAKLVQAIAKEHKVLTSNVLLGAGSSELLTIATFMAQSLKKGSVIAPDPTFRVWQGATERMGIPIERIPLTAEKQTDLVATKAAISKDTNLIYLCSPNNPTGIAIPDIELREFIASAPRDIIILLDEAYVEYEDKESTVNLIHQYPNLIIARTFSKIYGLAAIRAGYVIGNEKIIDHMGKLQSWHNASVSATSVAAALSVIHDHEFLAYCKKENAKCRAIFHQCLLDLGIPHTPSVASFSYLDTAAYSGNLVETLEKNNIFGARSFEENSTWIRLSIGTQEEMEKVVRVLKAGVYL